MYIRVIVKTGQRSESVNETGENRFAVSIREKPERGLANKRILELMRDYFKNPAGGVKIISGHHSHTKLIKIGNE